MSEKPTENIEALASKTLSFGEGNAALPMEKVARYAFRRAMQDGPEEYVSGGTAAAHWGHRWGKVMDDMSDYFTRRGFVTPGYGDLTVDSMMVTTGTTNAYDIIMQTIADDVKDRSRYRAHYRLAPVKPVIVMPVPTYGLFFPQPKKYGIEVVTIDRDMKNGGRVNPQELVELFRSMIRANKRVVAYYDSNPNNPLGTIRGEAETREIGRILMSLAYAHDHKVDSRGRGRHMSIWDGPAGKFRIIDDMVYDGLEYPGAAKPYPFALLEKETPGIAHHTMTLFGTSKAGLATFRAGLVIGEPRYIREMATIQRASDLFAPAMAVHALSAYFTDHKTHTRWRNEHLGCLNARHEFAGKFMKALINGIDDVSCTTDEINRMCTVLRECGQPEDRLTRGVPGVRVFTTPQAGFFHLLDFSGVKGSYYFPHRPDTGGFKETKRFRGQESVSDLAVNEKLGFVYGQWMGIKDNIPIVRASFAKPLPEIVELALRLDRMVQSVTPPRVSHKKPTPALA